MQQLDILGEIRDIVFFGDQRQYFLQRAYWMCWIANRVER